MPADPWICLFVSFAVATPNPAPRRVLNAACPMFGQRVPSPGKRRGRTKGVDNENDLRQRERNRTPARPRSLNGTTPQRPIKISDHPHYAIPARHSLRGRARPMAPYRRPYVPIVQCARPASATSPPASGGHCPDCLYPFPAGAQLRSRPPVFSEITHVRPTRPPRPECAGLSPVAAPSQAAPQADCEFDARAPSAHATRPRCAYRCRASPRRHCQAAGPILPPLRPSDEMALLRTLPGKRRCILREDRQEISRL